MAGVSSGQLFEKRLARMVAMVEAGRSWVAFKEDGHFDDDVGDITVRIRLMGLLSC